MSSNTISAIPPYGSQSDPTRSNLSRIEQGALAPSRSPIEARALADPQQPAAASGPAKAVDPAPSPFRPFELSVGRSRDGTGVIIDLLVPPANIPFARVFGADDPPPSVDVKA